MKKGLDRLPVVRRETKGFTLIELLVVIAIIVLLIAMIIPGFSWVLAAARQFQCANNLHHIGVAVRKAQGDGQRKGHQDGFIVSGWRGRLPDDLEDEVFVCPEDDPKATGSSGSWPVAVHAWATYNSDDYIQEFEPGVLMRKLSDEQYQAAGLHDGKKVVNLPEYVPGSNPNLYWYVLEDWHWGYEQGNCDFDWDLHIKVTESGLGWITILLKQMGTGYQFELIELSTNNVLMTKGEMTGNAPDAEYGFAGGGLSSYGLNEGLSPIRYSTGKKILGMDYEAQIVQPDSDLWTDGMWDEDNNGILDFARHKGAINVLFTDGSVEARRPEQIDPYYPTIRDTYWVRGQ